MTEKIHSFPPLVDQFSRTISYLRLSLTDKCNLRCIYCMPSEQLPSEPDSNKLHFKSAKFLENSELLSYEELLRIVRLAVSLGMSKLRLTGGEPLVRRGVIDFIYELSAINGLKQVRLTTNGVLLEQYAADLYQAGIRHINMSLDTLNANKFLKITGKDQFEKVWRGLNLAAGMGFNLKLNVVAMKGVNDDEFIDFGRLALKKNIQVRFIEFMPVGEKDSWKKEQFIQADKIKEKLLPLGNLVPKNTGFGNGPARMFELCDQAGAKGAVGFISPISHHFCDKCNRLRLTSEGRLRACLLKDYETDLRALLRQGASDAELIKSIRDTVMNKPQGHTLQSELEVEDKARCSGKMSRIGG